jgi:glycosyltransferase involved in cell wall biosynthesis
MKTSVILPAKNEEDLIKSVVMDIYKHLSKKKYRFQILIVVNGCSDKTSVLSQQLAKKYRQIIVLESKPGYGYALRKGLKAAIGKYVVIYNVDFYDLKLIDLVDIDLYGKDLIIGSKMAPWSIDGRKSVTRKLVTKLFNSYLSVVHGFRGSDTHGIKLVKKLAIDKVLPKCRTKSGIFDTELVLRIQNEGFKIADFPVEVREIRPSRFAKRLLDTPRDVFDLYRAMKI